MKTGPKADKPAASRVAKIEGKKLHYLTAGQGLALIHLHGYTQTSRMWRPLIDKLKDKFTVIAPDLPGIGDSDIPKDGCDMKTAAIRIHALAKSIGVTKARVVGHDIGLMVAYAYCFLAASEASARAGLARANNELRATGELLANTSRLTERERISRELHDTLGHHLTALSLNLEAASHLAGDNALVQIQRAQSVTKLLLSDLRGVVSALRGEDPIGLAQALRTLVAGVAAPQIHLVISEDLAIDDPTRAHTVLRCVQEIITNAIRHAAAGNLWIELLRTGNGAAIRSRDDGRGT